MFGEDKIIKYEFEDGTVVNITVRALLDFKKTKEELQHKQKIINKLSRKIQNLKSENRLLNNQFKIQILRGNRGYGKCYENKMNFLIEREKKLQLIEQMFTSGHVDLFKLDQLVRFNKF